MQIEISLQNISKQFGSRLVFSRLNANLHGGRCYCIYGANGIGKSTLLRCIGQLYRVDSGRVQALLDGQSCGREEFHERCGIVAPDFVLYDELTALENVQFFAGMRNSALTLADIQAALEYVGLSYESYQPVRGFSTGMKQRLKLAVLYASDVPVWLMDEPSSNLDDAGKELVRDMIRRAQDGGRLIVLATNEWSEREYAAECINMAAYQADTPEGICG